jgi:hypothetical protein
MASATIAATPIPVHVAMAQSDSNHDVVSISMNGIELSEITGKDVPLQRSSPSDSSSSSELDYSSNGNGNSPNGSAPSSTSSTVNEGSSGEVRRSVSFHHRRVTTSASPKALIAPVGYYHNTCRCCQCVTVIYCNRISQRQAFLTVQPIWSILRLALVCLLFLRYHLTMRSSSPLCHLNQQWLQLCNRHWINQVSSLVQY